MLEFFVGIALGIAIGIYFEYSKSIKSINCNIPEEKTQKLKKGQSCSTLGLCEIKLRLLILKLHEQKKTHLLVFFWSIVISFVVIGFIFLNDSFTAGGGYMDKLIRTLEKINYSIQQDWGR
ncbi:MAG: hypothetical protein C0601_10990 [Candidatus Muiribacterium halophilum]|mgnify:CR=1 FL=1|uniref:Uncharacterized protein n=1 Tax=Muiribacterium halophilum TaxID=2053465 RepID=A0A2N5ZBT7_MUIH1|nr:MAG: hypothetical protein C0601_10990 [Candidatus Muirbacterium halophilum]